MRTRWLLTAFRSARGAWIDYQSWPFMIDHFLGQTIQGFPFYTDDILHMLVLYLSGATC